MLQCDRRTFLRGAATVGLATAIGALPGSTAAAANEHPAIWSDLVCQNSGTNTHQAWRRTVYRNDAAVLDLLQRAGVRYVRDKLAPASTAQHVAFRMFNAGGIKVHSTVLGDNLDATRAEVDAFMAKAAELGGANMFSSFEGPNEPNTHGGEWVRKTVMLMRNIRESRDDHCLSSIPIVGPALHHRRAMSNGDYAKLADAGVACYTDYTGLHFYPNGGDLASGLDTVLPLIRRVFPGQPVWLTETGWNTGLGITGYGNPVPEGVAAVYAQKALLQTFVRGLKVSLYEALSDAPGTGSSVWEENFGHLAECPSLDPSTWRDKPALVALHKLLSACADPGPTYAPRPLKARINASSDVRKLVLGKRNGTYLVLLWRDVNVYLSAARRRVDVGTRSVEIVTSTGARTVDVGAEVAIVAL